MGGALWRPEQGPEQRDFQSHVRGTPGPYINFERQRTAYSAGGVYPRAWWPGEIHATKGSSGQGQREGGKPDLQGSCLRARQRPDMRLPCMSGSLTCRKAENLPCQPGKMKRCVTSHSKSLAHMMRSQLNWHIPHSSSSFPSPPSLYTTFFQTLPFCPASVSPRKVLHRLNQQYLGQWWEAQEATSPSPLPRGHSGTVPICKAAGA